jgi:tellurite resistance protein
MLMPVNALVFIVLLMPVILGMTMVSHNIYRFFGSHPELGFSSENNAIVMAVLSFIVSGAIVAMPLTGIGGAFAVVSFLVTLAYVGVALYYVKKWVMQTIHTTHDELTKCASAITTTSFQKSTMGMTALLLASGKRTEILTDEQRAEVVERIKHARAFDHLPTDALVGYFNTYLGDIEHPVCMYAWESTLNKVKGLSDDRYQTDIAMRVAVSIVGGRNGRNIDMDRLQQVAGTLGLDPSKYTN